MHVLSESHVSPVTSLSFLSKEGGDYFISGGRDQVINYWSLSEEGVELLKVLPVYEVLCNMPRGTLIRIFRLLKVCKLYLMIWVGGARSPWQLLEIKVSMTFILSLEISNHTLFTYFLLLGILKLWDLITGQCIQSLHSLPQSSDSGHIFTHLLYSSALNSLVGVSSDHTLLFYSLKDGSINNVSTWCL